MQRVRHSLSSISIGFSRSIESSTCYGIGRFRAGWAASAQNRCTSITGRTNQAIGFRLFSSQAQDPTIYALSTAPGRAAIAIIRCSGERCLDIYTGLCPDSPPLRPRRAAVRTLLRPSQDSSRKEVLDASALVLYFPGPNTATGEDVLEFHVHGGPAIVKAVLAAIPKTAGLEIALHSSIRYAEPGEFTRRAFYNNRLDLTQVEALGDTLSAETEQQRRLAVQGMSNTLNDRYEDWRTQLLYARGELEALIDFSEDQHFDESAEEFVKSISSQIRTLISNIEATTRNAAKGELLRHGIKIALLGAPNAGKSSLLNRIVGREAAIVSSEAGTTRDVIEVNVDIGGFFCKFNDLAGVRSQSMNESKIGQIEQEGIRRAKAHAREANIVVVVLPINVSSTGLPAAMLDEEILQFVKYKLQPHQKVLFLASKSDLAGDLLESLLAEMAEALATAMGRPCSVLPVSCLETPPEASIATPAVDVQTFLGTLTKELARLTEAEQIGDSPPGCYEASLGTTTRQQVLLAQCAHELQAFLKDVEQTPAADQSAENNAEVDVVLAAESLRTAADCLARITGRGESGDVEEVLGVVFEKFCVGK